MPRCEVPEEKASQASRGGSSGDGGSEKRPPLLAIEWHRFSFAFNGDFKIRDLPVRLSPASESRPSSLQEDADTGALGHGLEEPFACALETAGGGGCGDVSVCLKGRCVGLKS